MLMDAPRAIHHPGTVAANGFADNAVSVMGFDCAVKGLAHEAKESPSGHARQCTFDSARIPTGRKPATQVVAALG
jgi:hypothetical protein